MQNERQNRTHKFAFLPAERYTCIAFSYGCLGMAENEKSSPLYVLPSQQEIQDFFTYMQPQQELQNALQMPGLPQALLDKITPAYFAKKHNNFHLKLYHDPKVRAGYGLETPEMQAFLQTQQGE